MSAATELNPFGDLPFHLYCRPEVQAARRAYIRSLAQQAAVELAEAGACDDPDEMLAHIGEAAKAIHLADIEALKVSLK